MSKSLSAIMHDAMHKKRPRIRAYVHVKAVWKRDRRGRFVTLLRKAHTRKIMDWKAPWVSNMEMMAENIASNNTLLKGLLAR